MMQKYVQAITICMSDESFFLFLSLTFGFGGQAESGAGSLYPFTCNNCNKNVTNNRIYHMLCSHVVKTR